MTVQELAEQLQLKILTKSDTARCVTGGYCGDLLSWVMSRASTGDCWFTVMGNINAVAVAVLADCACIVLCENATLDDDAKARAEQQDVSVLQSDKNAFSLAIKLGELL